MRKYGSLILLAALSTVPVRAQEPVEEEIWKNGWWVTGTYSGVSSADGYYKMNVNLFNGGLNLAIPLVSLKGRAGHDVSLVATYNSRQFWRRWNDFNQWYECGFYSNAPHSGRWIINN